MGRLPTGFTRRKDGLLQYAFSVDGKRRYVYGSSVKDCRDKADELKEKIAKGLLISRQTIKLSEYFEEWEARREKIVKPTTIYTDKRRFKRIDAAIGHKKLADIDRRDVYKLQRDLSDELSSNGVNDAISLLRTLMESAVNDRILQYNPTTGIKSLPKTEEEKAELNEKHRFLTADEITTFFEYAQSSVYYNFFMFLLLTGVRCGEGGALEWKDIDREKGVIHITKTVTRIDDHTFNIGSPKTMDSKRDILLTDEVAAILEKQKVQQAQLFGIKAVAGSERIFTTSTGKLINQSNTSPTIANICRKAEAAGKPVLRFTPHAFRHTFISHELANNIPLNVIARQVGHSNTITLQKYYSHEDPEKLKEAFRMVSRNMAEIIKIS